MVLWQVTSYRAALQTEQRRLRAMTLLEQRYGQRWRRHAPADLTWMLRTGVLLDEALALVADLMGHDHPPLAESPDWSSSAECSVSLDSQTRADRSDVALPGADQSHPVPPSQNGAAATGIPHHHAASGRSDDDLVADMRQRWVNDPPSREQVRKLYGIGSGWASRLLGRWRPQQVPGPGHSQPYPAPDRLARQAAGTLSPPEWARAPII
jgi:hypothetical protein